jgi:hypothetical protein
MEDQFQIPELDNVLNQNRETIINGIFGTQTSIQVESSTTFAEYLSHVGINRSNYLLFLRILETNNKWVVDAVIEKRDPRLLFTVIKPNSYLISRAFKLLAFWHPGQIFSKVLLAVLGIVEYSFHKPDDGYRIYKLEISDLSNLGKYLDESKDQMDPINETILEILDRITNLGEYRPTIQKSALVKHAFNIRIAYFDNTKSLMDNIPKILLVRLKREDREVKPSKHFLDYSRKKNKDV